MKFYKFFILFLFAGGLITSCSNNDDIEDFPEEKPDNSLTAEEELELEIKDFEYKAMDIWYYYNDDMDIYNDNYFGNQSELNEWLMTWDDPEELYYDGLLLNYPDTDRFSWIVDDYEELENQFSGTTTSTGIDYGLTYACDGCNNIILYARYVLPNTPAEDAGIERGMVFTEINGQELNINNYSSLLAESSWTLTLGEISDSGVDSTSETIDVSKTTVNENPVFITKTLDVDGKTVGYIMYNSFIFDYSSELNAAFGELKAANIDELVLDLRYNGGGRIDTAIDLASMITGQFNNEPFVKFQYNSYIQNVYESQGSDLTYRMDSTVNSPSGEEGTNSLNLSKVYVIATGSSASASELVINSLKPFIDVVHVGTTTVGKVQGSNTFYDSDAPNFDKDNSLNPDHKYALQPLVLSLVNKNNEAHPEGLSPDVEQREFISTYGILGDPNEPLLATTLELIRTGSRNMIPFEKTGKVPTNVISESKAEQFNYQRMYIDVNLPDQNN
ncbi:S41 family peptidase [Gramella lutea]|uniref:S41 family peptidase n=1 Tax=Christiangramia lutea TaxID=1607951 RepID=A0A9X1V258_9FLAO|nr:S41 family peptidase [Christiangramia lutea]MCH4822915.1 S41 family peptidase [Christiangramia lutea]